MRKVRFVLLAVVHAVCGCSSSGPAGGAAGPFDVSGTVNGLRGVGLVLGLGGESLEVTGNGSFTFSTSVERGSSVEVVVVSQPTAPAQICEVSRGSVENVRADVVSVRVNCTSTEQSIMVAVSGVVGRVDVQLNGDEILTFDADGTQAFATALPEGAPFDVTVAPPTGLQCAVTDGVGVVSDTPPSMVQVSCGLETFLLGGISIDVDLSLASAAGLMAQPLILQEAGGQTVSIDASGEFEFAQPLMAGDAYSVTVAQQPLAQNCTISGGSGIVDASSPRVMVVSCDEAFLVRGVVAGLTGAGLVLNLNAAEDLPISANGSFAFSSSLSSESPYAVTVAVSPTGPQQTCVVTGGSGTIGDQSIEDVVVSCADELFDLSIEFVGSGSFRAYYFDDDRFFSSPTTSTLVQIAEGTAYDILIEPSGNTNCSPLSASGVMGAGPVTVPVTCERLYRASFDVFNYRGHGMLVRVGTEVVSLEYTETVVSTAQAFPEGATPDIEVLEQPIEPSQVCTPSANTVTFVDADNTDVSFTCVDATETVAGTITGATGPLTYRVNGANPETTSAATFMHPTGMDSRHWYVVAFDSLPAGQTCRIDNASGPAWELDSTSVDIECANTTAIAVSPLYPTNGADWNDSIDADGATVVDYSDTACSGYPCVNGGQLRAVVTAETSCNGLYARDTYGVFTWVCDDSVSPVRMVSVDLEPRGGLMNLVSHEAGNVGWLPQSVFVYNASGLLFATDPTVWWGNAVSEATDLSLLNTAGEISVFTSPQTGELVVEATRGGVVIPSWAEFTGTTDTTTILAQSASDVWLEGFVDGVDASTAVSAEFVQRFRVQRLHSRNADVGLAIEGGGAPILRNVFGVGHNTAGIQTENTSLATISDARIADGGLGIEIDGGSNVVERATVSGSGIAVYLSGGSANRVVDLLAFNNSTGFRTLSTNGNTLERARLSDNSTGIELYRSRDNLVIDATIRGGESGVELANSYADDNRLFGITVTGADKQCVTLSPGSQPLGNLLMNVLCADSGYGLETFEGAFEVVAGVRTTVANLVVTDTPGAGLYSFAGDEGAYVGILSLPAANPCSVISSAGSGISNTCMPTGLSTATLSTSGSSLGTFAGLYAAVTTDGTNPQGTAPVDGNRIIDLRSFDEPYRMFGVVSAGDASTAGRQFSGTYQIIDQGLAGGDTLALGALAPPADGDDTITHTYMGGGTQTFLRNTIELSEDGIGDDDGFCESNEDCLVTLNVGAYQGHGSLLTAGSIGAGGTIENVQLWGYANNGY